MLRGARMHQDGLTESPAFGLASAQTPNGQLLPANIPYGRGFCARSKMLRHFAAPPHSLGLGQHIMLEAGFEWSINTANFAFERQKYKVEVQGGMCRCTGNVSGRFSRVPPAGGTLLRALCSFSVFRSSPAWKIVSGGGSMCAVAQWWERGGRQCFALC